MLNNITRRDIVGDVLTLFDYVEELERENERLKNEVDAKPRRSKKEETNYIDVIMIERGKNEIFGEVFRNWNCVQCSYNEDTEKYEFTPFNKWIESKLDMDDMPKVLSFEDFVCYFKEELQERYTKEKEEALRKFKEEKED